MTLAAPGGQAAGLRAGPGAAGIDRVAVVIPAHNEEQVLERALTAAGTAADRLAVASPGTAVEVVVVLDSCTDRSVEVAAAVTALDLRFRVLPVTFHSVGKSRRAGCRAVLESLGGSGAVEGSAVNIPARRVWLANTDADSQVPENWLVRQLELAAGGADVVLGSVEPDAHGTNHELLARWHARHALAENHPHVHGANLGVRASAYLSAGGFPGIDRDEDLALVERLRRAGAGIVATDTMRVLTSGRTSGRAPGGFAAYLLALAQP
ncbi:glycosyltransferase [Pseudarthrobacter sp. NPDC058196]|uniref:glycosyltransferase n=1 Tax=Pseudarthrobacter sp. NPDC058196 TaxID=3346376 RepID=UPI0036DA83FA